MKDKKVIWLSSLAEITDAPKNGHFHHPGLRYASFVFCDDKPTEDKRGIEYEDFPALAESAIGTPVKIRFLGEGIGNHIGSIPIGYITDMTENTTADGTHQLIAGATLFADEYPDEIEFLETSFASEKAPGISWELSYKSSVIKEGITWLKGILARAATFVRDPAYGSRTALLALASNSTIKDEKFSEELTTFANEFRSKLVPKGGNHTVTEEEAKKLQERLEAAEAKQRELEDKVTELETANASLTTDKETLTSQLTEKETALAEIEKEKLIAARTQAVTEAGLKLETDPEKLAKKQAIWVHMDEDSFAEYVEDLKAVAAKPTPSLASLQRANASKLDLPRLKPEEGRTNVTDLKERFSRR